MYMGGNLGFYKVLEEKMHCLVMQVYDSTENFPKSELYGSVSQIRRASVSVILNFLEGYARFKPKVKLNFFEISYGSLKETKYLLYLAFQRKWITEDIFISLNNISEEISKMLWSIINSLNHSTHD